jgi:hypothetical protein
VQKESETKKRVRKECLNIMQQVKFMTNLVRIVRVCNNVLSDKTPAKATTVCDKDVRIQKRPAATTAANTHNHALAQKPLHDVGQRRAFLHGEVRQTKDMTLWQEHRLVPVKIEFVVGAGECKWVSGADVGVWTCEVFSAKLYADV